MILATALAAEGGEAEEGEGESTRLKYQVGVERILSFAGEADIREIDQKIAGISWKERIQKLEETLTGAVAVAEDTKEDLRTSNLTTKVIKTVQIKRV